MELILDHYLDALKALETILDRNNWHQWRDNIRNDIFLWEREKLSEQHRGNYGGMGSFNDISISHPLENNYLMNIQSIAYNLAGKSKIDPADIGKHLGSIGSLLNGWVCSNGHEETFPSNINVLTAHILARDDVIAYYAEAKLHELVKDRKHGSFLLYEDKCMQITEIVKSSGLKVVLPDRKLKPCFTCGNSDLKHQYWALDDEGKKFVKVNHGLVEIPQNIRDVFK